MSSHPYWAYGPDSHGVPAPAEEYAKAVEEGRRAFALELAVRSLEIDTDLISASDYLVRANAFVAYLKGDNA